MSGRRAAADEADKRAFARILLAQMRDLIELQPKVSQTDLQNAFGKSPAPLKDADRRLL
jgi:hypothetical protein